MSLYEQTIDIRSEPICGHNWIGNLRWFARESINVLYTFYTIPVNDAEAEEVSGSLVNDALDIRTLFSIQGIVDKYS